MNDIAMKLCEVFFATSGAILALIKVRRYLFEFKDGDTFYIFN